MLEYKLYTEKGTNFIDIKSEMNKITTNILRFHYNKIDDIVIENIPDNILIDLYYRIKTEMIKRKIK